MSSPQEKVNEWLKCLQKAQSDTVQLHDVTQQAQLHQQQCSPLKLRLVEIIPFLLMLHYLGCKIHLLPNIDNCCVKMQRPKAQCNFVLILTFITPASHIWPRPIIKALKLEAIKFTSLHHRQGQKFPSLSSVNTRTRTGWWFRPQREPQLKHGPRGW